MGSTSLKSHFRFLGAVVLVAHAAMTLMSPFQAAILWDAESAPRGHQFFADLARALPALPIQTLLEDNEAVLISHGLALAVVSIATLLALVLLRRSTGNADEGCVRTVRRFAFAFVALSLPAFPVFTQDFWLSMAWGRMTAHGINPYYVEFTADFLTGLPLDHFPMRMSYGPMWAIISGLVMMIAGTDVLLAAVLFKMLLGMAWIAVLRLVEMLLRDAAPAARAAALLLVGWLPVGVTEAVAEGHNDVLLAAFMLSWWLLRQRRAGFSAPLVLAASALCKYTTAPLFLLDAVQALRAERQSLPRYLLSLLPAAMLVVLAFAPFLRSLGFFEGLVMVGGWQFLSLRDAADVLQRFTGIPALVPGLAAKAVFALAAFLAILRFIRDPQTKCAIQALIAVMAFIAFGASPHIWPWYLVWIMAPAALLPGWWLSRFVIGVGLAVPFVIGCWWVDEIEDYKDVAAFLLYATAILWAVLSRGLLPPPSASPRTGDEAGGIRLQPSGEG